MYVFFRFELCSDFAQSLKTSSLTTVRFCLFRAQILIKMRSAVAVLFLPLGGSNLFDDAWIIWSARLIFEPAQKIKFPSRLLPLPSRALSRAAYILTMKGHSHEFDRIKVSSVRLFIEVCLVLCALFYRELWLSENSVFDSHVLAIASSRQV